LTNFYNYVTLQTAPTKPEEFTMKEFIRKTVDRFGWYDVLYKHYVLVIIVVILAVIALYSSVFNALLSSPTVMTWLHTPVTAMEIKDVCIIAFIAALIAK